jgi:glutamyl-tRNA(Gln) amidotransferase subunit E
MYPDTDSAPIPIDEDYIDSINKRLPVDVSKRYSQMKKWGIPPDTLPYLLRNNLVPLMEKIIRDLEIDPGFVGTLLGHTLKHIEGQLIPIVHFSYDKVYDLLNFLKENKKDMALAKKFLFEIYRHPQMDFQSHLTALDYKEVSENEILEKATYLVECVEQSIVSKNKGARIRWIMGQIRESALGNISMSHLAKFVEEILDNKNPKKRVFR